MKPLKIVFAISRILLNFLAVLYVLDLFTFGLASGTLHYTGVGIMHVSRWWLVQGLLFAYSAYRLSMFVWHRFKVTKRLRQKREDTADKHIRLLEKLKGVEITQLGGRPLGELSVADLRQLIETQSISPRDLLDMYQKQALQLLHSQPGCISEVVFASDVYAILAEEMLGQSDSAHMSPLVGIPVAVPEIFPLRDSDHTMGYTCLAQKFADRDCAFVAALKEAGAIPFVVTNVRQKILGLSAKNPIYGHAVHPTHRTRVCVGGDAVFVYHGGCPLSFGADIIGDARFSAAFCGLACLKPTVTRMSQSEMDLPIPMPSGLGVVPSPIGRKVDDLADAMRALWTPTLATQDPLVYSHKFDEGMFASVESKKLRIGFYTGFPGLLPSSPAMERVIDEAKQYLANKGHELVEFSPQEPEMGYRLVVSALASTMEPGILNLVYKKGHGDVMVDRKQRALHLLFALPQAIRKHICYWRAKRVKNEFPVTALALRGLSCSESVSELTLEVERYRQAFYESWDGAGLDCLICPVSPIPAPLCDSGFYVVNMVLLYTSLYNLLGYPAGTVRIGSVERSDIEIIRRNATCGQHDQNLNEFAKQFHQAEGLPIGLQVVARPWNDELLLGVMKQLEGRKNLQTD